MTQPLSDDDAIPIPLDEPAEDIPAAEPPDEADVPHELLVEPAEPAPVPTPSEQGPGVLAALNALSDRFDRRLDGLQTLIDREIRAESTREKVVDRLHAELQEYKQDLLLNTLRPVFIDLVQLHDDIGKVAVGPALDEPNPEAARLIELMLGFQQGIEDILYRQGVEPFAVDGETFDPRRQRAVAVEPTDDPEKNKTVAGRLRKGFRSGDRVIRPEIVSVYTIKK
jgi:molecular chaperone GrpE